MFLFEFADLSQRTTSAETFLLSSAALANLSFMYDFRGFCIKNIVLFNAILAISRSPAKVTAAMRHHGTVRVLVEAVAKQRAVSIYIQDQVREVIFGRLLG